MNKIAVTGANGMMGSHMMSLLESKGIPAKAVTRKEWDLAEWKSFDELDFIFGLTRAVFHFGAQLPYDDSNGKSQQSQQIFDTNVRSCLNLAEWANLRNIPIVFLSSAVVYKNPYLSDITEGDSKVVNGLGGLYGYSKVLAEGVLNHLSANGLKCIILRPSSLYGYGLPSNKLIQNYINIASSGGVIEVIGSRNKVNFIHAYDVSNAALQAYFSESWGVFNISSDAPSSILEIAEIAVSISKSGSISVLDEPDYDAFLRFNLNSDLAKNNFNFHPVVGLRMGMNLMKNKTVSLC
jgi:nucleoside-diphosphate-sugar epimerase